MPNVHIQFYKLDSVIPDEMRKGKIKPGYEHFNAHIIFDINMDGNFTRKARLVANGHTKALPSSITYSSVVYRESVGIAFIFASLNNLDIFAFDIGNSQLSAKFRETIWTEAGTDCGT